MVDELNRYWRRVPRSRPSQDEMEPVGPGEESVWDFPRPPRLEDVKDEIVVRFAGEVIARTTRGKRVCETAGAPTYYIPPEDVKEEVLVPSSTASFCEWKGAARYFTLRHEGQESPDAAWRYPTPSEGFGDIAGWLCFYPGRVESCTVGGLPVTPQPGGYYGGWVLPNLRGPIKGEPGTEFW